MKRQLLTMGWLIMAWAPLSSQLSYLDHPGLLEKVEVCLHHTYGFSFEEARRCQAELLSATPNHPAPLFLEALIVYWENFPLNPSDNSSKHFIDLMDKCIDLSSKLREDTLSYTEGVFFDLFGRAFKAMFWADNGKTGKLIPDLGNMYRYTKKGFDLQEEFVEFYFSTGLYNYYVEAYPEAHPGVKPLLAFMHKGDRELGLKKLHHAILNTVFLKVEAILFMSLIQLNYEKDINSAAIYAERLVKDFPFNILYQGHLINILLHQHRFDFVRSLLDEAALQEDRYSLMIRTFALAFLAEYEHGDKNQARGGYVETIDLAESFGPFADIYGAMGYMGLSRLHEREGLHKEAEGFKRKASKLSSYEFIFED